MKTIHIHWFLSISLLLLIKSQVIGQSENYTIESFQEVYTELENYESVGIIANGNPLWELEFDLNFPFPFYDSLYNKIIYRGEAWGSLTEDEDVGLLIMDFFGGYSWSDLNDTSNITSDVRFSHILSNNMQAFVLQFTKIEFFADPFGGTLDTYFNFQLVFYENGVIEARFGENHMDGTPIYDPGKGFYCYTTSGGVDTSEICGPFMGISNPLDEEDAIALSGSYDDYEISGNLYSVLNTLPPNGWVIRFKPKSVGIFEPEQRILQLDVKPNPAIDYISMSENSIVTIFDFSGKPVYQGKPTGNKLNVSALTTGLYFIRVASGNSQSVGRFIKL